MTGDELDRTINFLLNSQANLELRIEQTNEQLARTAAQLSEQLARTNEQVEQLSSHMNSFADTQAGIMRVLMENIEAQNRTNKTLKGEQKRMKEAFKAEQEAQARFNDSFRASMTELAAAQTRTEEALGRLTVRVDALTVKVDKLADIVEGERGNR